MTLLSNTDAEIEWDFVVVMCSIEVLKTVVLDG